MPAALNTYTPIVRLAEDVEDIVYNFRPSDTPLVSSIGRVKVAAHFHEWTADTYRAVNPANAAQEGADATPTAGVQPVNYGNRTQIVQDAISVSGTGEVVHKYGRSSEMAFQKTKRMVELKRDVEAAAIGNPVSVAHASGVAGQMRGLYGWCATNSYSGAGGAAPNPITNVAPTAGTLRAFTETLLKPAILGVYQNGGDAGVLLVTPSHKQVVSTFTGNVQRTNEVTGMGSSGHKGKIELYTAFTIYGHDFGETMVVPDRCMGTGSAGLVNTAYIVDYDKIKLGTLRPFTSFDLAKIGDSERAQILTEVTLVVAQESTLAAIRDLNP